MKKFKISKLIIIFVSIILALSLGCSRDREEEKNNSNNMVENEKDLQNLEGDNLNNKIKNQIDSMSLDEKIGQLLIVGFEGTAIDENIESSIRDLKVGGIIYFKRNIKNPDQVVDLNNKIIDINKDNKIPLFISIDEEGGRVSRLSNEYIGLPTAKTLGDLDREDLSFQYGKLLGARLKSLGFNLNYAPVMDINSNINNPVIGDRSFGDKAELVSRHGIQVMEGIRSKGIISSVKHFPGHGDTGLDSHIGLPTINKELEEMKEFELYPFKKAIEKDVDMVMVAHILFSQIDKKYPSTMSRKIIHNILREELGFSGVVISDDLTMGAITKNYSLEEATLKFLQAGGDIGLISHGKDNPKRVFNYLKEAIEGNQLSIEDIDSKLYRILSLKEKYKLRDDIILKPNIEDINNKTEELLNKIG